MSLENVINYIFLHGIVNVRFSVFFFLAFCCSLDFSRINSKWLHRKNIQCKRNSSTIFGCFRCKCALYFRFVRVQFEIELNRHNISMRFKWILWILANFSANIIVVFLSSSRMFISIEFWHFLWVCALWLMWLCPKYESHLIRMCCLKLPSNILPMRTCILWIECEKKDGRTRTRGDECKQMCRTVAVKNRKW